MLIKQYDTSLQKGLWVGFTPWMAFVVRDDQGYFNKEDIEQGIFKAELLKSPDDVDGLYIVAVAGRLDNGRVQAEICAPQQFQEELYRICTYKERKLAVPKCLNPNCDYDKEVFDCSGYCQYDEVLIFMQENNIDDIDRHVLEEILDTLRLLNKQQGTI